VVEASRNELTIQMEGRSVRYRVESMPLPLLLAIGKQTFVPTAGSKVIVGSFWAMDREGNRQMARRLWQEAAKSGESLGKDLLPELDVPLPGVSAKPKR
jgi:hypothetical protein